MYMYFLTFFTILTVIMLITTAGVLILVRSVLPYFYPNWGFKIIDKA